MIAAISHEGNTTIMMDGTLPEVFADTACIVEGVFEKIPDNEDKLIFMTGLVVSLKNMIGGGN